MGARWQWHTMSMRRIQQLGLLLGVALVAAVAAAATMIWLPQAGTSDERDLVATHLPQAREIPAVNLQQHTGQTWQAAHPQGRWQLVFFGFTYCPDVCPTTLADLAGMLERLEPDSTPTPEVVFISVDPDRDSLQRLDDYVGHFHDDFVGVTGARDQIDTLTQALGIAYTLHEPGADGQYAVDHSSAILLLNPQGQLQALWQPPHGRSVLAEEFKIIRQRVNAGRS